MAFNGNGVFSRLYNWTADAANAIPILAVRFDAEDNGFATGLSNCVTRDGQSPPTANIPMGTFKLTGLGNATAGTDALNQATGDARYARYSDTTANFTGALQHNGNGVAAYADTTANFTGALQSSGVAVATGSSGNFSMTIGGITVFAVFTCYYRVAGGLVTLYNKGATAQGTSNTNSLGTTSALPTALRPAAQVSVPSIIIDSSSQYVGVVTIATDGTMTWASPRLGPLSYVGFNTASGKGVPTDWSITFPLVI